jgi:hypothetical protein
VANGTVVYWGVWNVGSSQAINTADFTATTGSVTINNNTGTFVLSATADLTTEGSEEFTVALSTGSNYTGTELARTSTIVINDTSRYSPTITAGSSDTRGSGSNQTYNINITSLANTSSKQIIIACLTAGGNGVKSLVNTNIALANGYGITPAISMNANGGDTQSSIFNATWDNTGYADGTSATSIVSQVFSGSKDRSMLTICNIPVTSSNPQSPDVASTATSSAASGAGTSSMTLNIQSGDNIVILASGYTTTQRTFNFSGLSTLSQMDRRDQRIGSNQQTVLMLKAISSGNYTITCTPSGSMTSGHQMIAAIWR